MFDIIVEWCVKYHINVVFIIMCTQKRIESLAKKNKSKVLVFKQTFLKNENKLDLGWMNIIIIWFDYNQCLL